MLVLIVTVIFGLGIAYFATQNTTTITIKLAGYTLTDLPLYVMVVGSLLVGLLFAWIINLVSSISSSLTIHGKDKTIKEAKKTIADLTKKVHELELENTQLKAEYHHKSSDENSL